MQKRATIYLRQTLAEDADDLQAFTARESEADYSIAEVVRDLKQRAEI